MKIEELLETRKHPSYYNFDEVMDIYTRLEDFFAVDNPSEEEFNAHENLKNLYAQTDPETRREVEMGYAASDPDYMDGRPNTYR